jgi:hypothetical protein
MRALFRCFFLASSFGFFFWLLLLASSFWLLLFWTLNVTAESELLLELFLAGPKNQNQNFFLGGLQKHVQKALKLGGRAQEKDA